MSDINPSLVNTYRQVQKNPKQVQRHLASIELNYFKTYGKLYPTTKDESKELFEKVHNEFRELEIKKRLNPKRAALFLYLIHNTQGGMLSFNMNNESNTFTFCYCQNKLKQIPLIINKVEIYNKIFNLGNIKFSIKKYETVLNKIKNDSTALVLFDPPYVNYEEVSSSKDFTNCSYNYGINDFNHRELFDCLKHFAFTAKAGGIDQGVITIFILELDLDRIASGSGHVKSNQTIFTDQSIDQRALACVRTARNGNFNLMFEILFLIDFLFGRERFQNKVHQGFDPFAVGGGDGVRLAQGQFIELGLSRFR